MIPPYQSLYVFVKVSPTKILRFIQLQNYSPIPQSLSSSYSIDLHTSRSIIVCLRKKKISTNATALRATFSMPATIASAPPERSNFASSNSRITQPFRIPHSYHIGIDIDTSRSVIVCFPTKLPTNATALRATFSMPDTRRSPRMVQLRFIQLQNYSAIPQGKAYHLLIIQIPPDQYWYVFVKMMPTQIPTNAPLPYVPHFLCQPPQYQELL